ncbi:MAG: restriction endonuclease subunit S [Thermodesulfobacteriota bacterium]
MIVFRMSSEITRYELRPLEECVEVLDSLRKPINSDARRERQGDIPYYGANGQVGTIDEWIFDEELVLVAEDGGFFDDPVRPISYRISGKSWVNNHAHVLRPLQGFDVDWLNYSISQQDIRHLIKGATLKKLNQRELKQILIPCLSFDEQRRIVARIKECMERVKEINALRMESIEKSSAVLPSMLNEEFLDLRHTYQTCQIGELALETRYGTSKKCSSNPDGTAILRIPNVARGFVDFESLKYCFLDTKERQKISLETGDLLFVRTNGSRDLVGRCAIYEGDGDDQDYGFASYLIRVRLNKDKMRPHFLAFFLNSTHGRVELDKRRRTSAGQFNINSESLRNIEIPLPPLGVQDRVVETLRDRQAQVVQLQNALREAQESESHLRESILRKAFAGEL